MTDLLTAEDKMKLLFPHRPWETEPDEAEWVDTATGYKCRIVRNETTGTLCGYVGIPKEHRLYGLTYKNAERDNNDFEVHGGLTYSGSIEDADDGYHYFGFDTAHGGDLSPALVLAMMKWAGDATGFYEGETYRTWDYVKNNVQVLASQLLYCDKGGNHVS